MNIFPGFASIGDSQSPSIFDAIRNAGAAAKPAAVAKQSATEIPDPATKVTLSPEAQAHLNGMQDAANTLAAASQGKAAGEAAPKDDRSKDMSFDELFDRAEANNPVPRNENSVLKHAFTPEESKAQAKEMSMLLWSGGLERKNPEAAQAMRDAMANGTARIRMADDVPGVNTKTTQTFFDPSRPGAGSMTSTVSNPSPEIQAMLDAGKALISWKAGVGDIFITW